MILQCPLSYLIKTVEKYCHCTNESPLSNIIISSRSVNEYCKVLPEDRRISGLGSIQGPPTTPKSLKRGSCTLTVYRYTGFSSAFKKGG